MNSRLSLFFSLLVFTTLQLFSIDLSGKTFYADHGIDVWINFYEHQFEYIEYEYTKDDNYTKKIKRNDYKLINKNNLLYVAYGENYENEWLLIYNNFIIFLYKEENSVPFFIGTTNPRGFESVYFSNHLEFKCTSFLKEDGTEYIASNLSRMTIPRPWVEGVDGDGIGESILIKRKEYFCGFFLSNGYVSKNRPDLYLKNNRVKKIKIIDKTNGGEYYYELQDTPNFQRISIEKSVLEIEIIILEVYKGTKYSDTCVNYIFF